MLRLFQQPLERQAARLAGRPARGAARPDRSGPPPREAGAVRLPPPAHRARRSTACSPSTARRRRSWRAARASIPIINMRLATPAHVIDINFLQDEPREPVLDGGALRPRAARAPADGGALAARGRAAAAARQALAHVAHPAIRSRGTVVGSIAHADPAAELPAVMAGRGRQAHVRSASGRRTHPGRGAVRRPAADDAAGRASGSRRCACRSRAGGRRPSRSSRAAAATTRCAAWARLGGTPCT